MIRKLNFFTLIYPLDKPRQIQLFEQYKSKMFNDDLNSILLKLVALMQN